MRIVLMGNGRTMTMKKLIELDAALDALREVIVPAEDIGFGDESTDGYNDGINMAVTVVSGLPTVDAVPVRHGRWTIEDCHAATYWYCCSNCTAHHRARYAYCPSCGAVMDGKDGDNG